MQRQGGRRPAGLAALADLGRSRKGDSMKKPKPARKRKTVASSARRPSHARKHTKCAICGKPVGTGEEWVGNIEAATWFLNRLDPVNSVKMHRPCGELLPRVMAPHLPKLKLRPYPFRGGRKSVPNPDAMVCLWYFERCRDAQLQENAAQQISDLLLEFEDKYPIEWECSGWKDEFIVKLVLGNIQPGDFQEPERYAKYWFSQRWKQKKTLQRKIDHELSDTRMAAGAAVSDLNMIELEARLAAAMDAVRRGDSASYDAAFDNSVALPHTQFLWWLNEAWEKTHEEVKFVSSNSQNEQAAENHWLLKMSRLLIRNFRKDHPDFRLNNDELVGLCRAYHQEWRGADDANNIPPSAVLIRFVAAKHNVSPATVRRVRAEIGKRIVKRKQSRGKSARTSGRT
jgi:hypothetical protein